MEHDANPAVTRLAVFVCEHGAAKSVVAAAWLRRLAADAGVELRAVACGTDPAAELSTTAVDGLHRDGIVPAEPVPQPVSAADVEAAWRVIVLSPDIRPDALKGVPFETWAVPAISDGYEAARDDIVSRLRALVKDAGAERRSAR
jgi:arsenate reductase